MFMKVNGVIIREGQIKILWSGNDGFGELDIFSNKKDPYTESVYADETRSFEVMTEFMGEDFYRDALKSAIEYLIDNSKIIE